MTTTNSTAILNNSCVINGQRTYQPGFDSVPDLIRYYVGGADDNAVLSYGGGYDGSAISSMMSYQSAHTEVRIRYPCNRSHPLMTTNTLSDICTSELMEHGRLTRNQSHALALASELSEALKVPACVPITSVDKMSSLSPPSSPYENHRQRAVSPPSPPSHWARVSASVRSSNRKTPSATVTSVTISSPISLKSSSSTELKTSDLAHSKTLPRPSSSFSGLSRIAPKPSTSALHNLSCTTLPRRLTSLHPHSQTSGLSSFIPNPSALSSFEMSGTFPSTLSEDLDLYNTSSTSSIYGSNIDNNSKSGIIDMDAEIAAALSADEGYVDSNSKFIGLFRQPELTDVRSSFARTNLVNDNPSRLVNRRSRSRNHPSKSKNHSSKSAIYHVSSGYQKNSSESFAVSNDDNHESKQKNQPHSSLDNSSLILTLSKESIEIEPKCIDEQKKLDQKVLDPINLELPTRETGISLQQQQRERDVQQIELIQQSIENERAVEQLVPENILDPYCNSNNKKQSTKSTDLIHRQYLIAMSHRLEGSQDQLQRMECQNRRRHRQKNSLAKTQQPMRHTLHQNNENNDLFHILGNIPGTIINNPLNTELSSTTNQQMADFEVYNHQSQGEDHQMWEGDHQYSVENNYSLLQGQHSLVEKCQTLVDHKILAKEQHSPNSSTGDFPLTTINQPGIGQSVFQIQAQNSDQLNQIPGINQNIGSTFENDHSCTNKAFSINRDDISKRGIENTSTGPNTVDWNTDADYANICSTIIQEDKNMSIPVYKEGMIMELLNQSNGHPSQNTIPINTNRAHYCKDEIYKSNYYNSKLNTNKAIIDYENIVSCKTDDIKSIDYENIRIDCKMKHYREKLHRLFYDDSFGDASIASALRSIHLTIIGDPENFGGIIPVVGTGRLAAALCRADGRATVLPYRRLSREYEIGKKPIGLNLGSCPLQILGQVGPEGRRARLDIIERFACLQYLVAMTVIVTPCMLLIGDDNNDRVDLSDKQFEWSLEDEYEYRRRRFYYRCAGAGSLYLSGEDSNDDEDDDNYKCTVDWITERSYWLERLASQRAAALDKWIRTAADVKQAVGDVYGYRALMSALCSDRIQTLQDAWASLRQLYTATAVTFESRLRPEFLGSRDKHTNLAMDEGRHDLNSNDDNDIDILQLPPNATIPDPTALAVLYEYIYSNEDHDDGNRSITPVGFFDNNKKEDNNLRLGSLITSPLLQLSSLWSSPNSGITSGLGASMAVDYGLHDLHVLCNQYSEWIQQSYGNGTQNISCSKTPMLQLDRFRSNFRTLLRQYGGSDDENIDEEDYDENYNPEYCQKKSNNVLLCEETNESTHNGFTYEKHYEDKVEEYGSGSGDYDDCGDEDDDDATVICCSNRSSITTMTSVTATTKSELKNPVSGKIAEEMKRQMITKNRHCQQQTQDREEGSYYNWVKDAGACGRARPAPLDTVFRTELHVRLFWPPTIFLHDSNDTADTVNHQEAIPAYSLGTAYATTEQVIKSTDVQKQCPTILNQAINKQLDRAAKDMQLRYKIMDDFLDRACAYSTSTANMETENN